MADDFDPYAQWLGIAPKDHPIDHYCLLGVPRFESDLVKIAAAADARMKLVRSFQTGPRGGYTQKLLNEIAAAKLRLVDARSKAAYDESLRRKPDEDEFGLGDEDIVLPPSIEVTASDFAAPTGAAYPSASPPAGLDPPPALGPIVPTSAMRPASATAPAGPIITTTLPSKARHEKPSGGRRGKEPKPRSRAGLYGLAFVIGIAAIAGLVWTVGRGLQPGGTAESERAVVKVTKPETSAALGKVAVQQASGDVYLTPHNAEIHGASPTLVINDGEMAITDWTSADDWLSWQFQVRRGGIFRLNLTYAVHGDGAAGRIAIEVDGQRKSLALRDSGGPDNYITDQVLIGAKDPGLHTLELRAVEKPGSQVMILKEIAITPFRGRSTTSGAAPANTTPAAEPEVDWNEAMPDESAEPVPEQSVTDSP